MQNYAKNNTDYPFNPSSTPSMAAVYPIHRSQLQPTYPFSMRPDVPDSTLTPPPLGDRKATRPSEQGGAGAPKRAFSKRTVFTRAQLRALEERFTHQSFLTREEKIDLGEDLRLTERQIMIWFQNRRGRFKKRGSTDKAYQQKKQNVGSMLSSAPSAVTRQSASSQHATLTGSCGPPSAVLPSTANMHARVPPIGAPPRTWSNQHTGLIRHCAASSSGYLPLGIGQIQIGQLGHRAVSSSGYLPLDTASVRTQAAVSHCGPIYFGATKLQAETYGSGAMARVAQNCTFECIRPSYINRPGGEYMLEEPWSNDNHLSSFSQEPKFKTGDRMLMFNDCDSTFNGRDASFGRPCHDSAFHRLSNNPYNPLHNPCAQPLQLRNTCDSLGPQTAQFNGQSNYVTAESCLQGKWAGMNGGWGQLAQAQPAVPYWPQSGGFERGTENRTQNPANQCGQSLLVDQTWR